ncbi:MAG TPA: DUF1015 domain-containing protein [Kribbellaceae bacterium]
MPDASTLRLDPFRAWRFVAAKVSALGAVTSPPYDVLEPAMVRRLTESDLYNMVRLILPRDAALGSNRYDEAADRLRAWQRDGIVVPDSDHALYVYRQVVGTSQLCGLVGRLALDPPGTVVLPHEDVMSDPVDDRYELMRATRADLEPILLAYSGGGAATEAVEAALQGEPWVEAGTDDGGEHEVWRITDRETIAAVAADLAGRQALIADGHHRYRAYLRRQRTDGVGDGLAMLVDHDRHPLTLDAIHRTLPDVSLDLVTSRLPAGWLVRDGKVPDLPHGLALTDGGRWLTLYRDAVRPAADVSLLHDELLPAWGVDPDEAAYHHALTDALADARTDRITVVLRPPRLDQVLATARRGERLPRKATSFGPKPRAGLVFRTLDD